VNLVRLEPGQLWLITWRERIDKVIIDERLTVVLLLWWNARERYWQVLRTKMNGDLKFHPSASMWNEEILDLDSVDTNSYTIERLG
jgi:hypothetical protein